MGKAWLRVQVETDEREVQRTRVGRKSVPVEGRRKVDLEPCTTRRSDLERY